MLDNFCIFILSHGRPDRVFTYDFLVRSKYEGKVYIVIDDEDEAANGYFDRFGEKVLQFNKSEIAKQVDPGDNFSGKASTLYPRAAFWELAKKVGCRYFLQLDDDYTDFQYYYDSKGNYKYRPARKTLSKMFALVLEYFLSIPATTIALAQGGDFIGGGKNHKCKLLRKAMNTFFCSVDRPWKMCGRRNEDVNAYVLGSLRGELFFTLTQAKINQIQSQTNSGAITSAYLEAGTYVKSFYSVMYAPACVKIGTFGDPRSGNYRVHHEINWKATAPKILREEHKKLHANP